MMFEPTCRPETPYNPADRLYPIVRCMSCYAEVTGKNEDYFGKTAIAAWNRRPAQTYVKTWSENYDKMQSLLLDAYKVLAFAFNRIHALPRSQDTELANDIAALRARIAQMIDTKGLK